MRIDTLCQTARPATCRKRLRPSGRRVPVPRGHPEQIHRARHTRHRSGSMSPSEGRRNPPVTRFWQQSLATGFWPKSRTCVATGRHAWRWSSILTPILDQRLRKGCDLGGLIHTTTCAIEKRLDFGFEKHRHWHLGFANHNAFVFLRHRAWDKGQFGAPSLSKLNSALYTLVLKNGSGAYNRNVLRAGNCRRISMPK